MANIDTPRKSLVGVIVDGIEGGSEKAVAIVAAEGTYSAVELALGTFGTQEKAAKALGLTSALLNKWLRTKTIDEWSVGMLKKLAELSGIKFEHLVNGSPQLPLPSNRADAPVLKARRARKNGKA